MAPANGRIRTSSSTFHRRISKSRVDLSIRTLYRMQMYAMETQEISRCHMRSTSVVSVKPKSYQISAKADGLQTSVLHNTSNMTRRKMPLCSNSVRCWRSRE